MKLGMKLDLIIASVAGIVLTGGGLLLDFIFTELPKPLIIYAPLSFIGCTALILVILIIDKFNKL